MHKIQFTTQCCKTYAECFPATRIFTILFPIVNSVSSTIVCTIRERHITGTQRPFLRAVVYTTTKRICERLNRRLFLSFSIPSISLHSKTDLHSVCRENEMNPQQWACSDTAVERRQVSLRMLLSAVHFVTKSDRVISPWGYGGRDHGVLGKAA